MLYRADENQLTQLARTGMMLGVVEDTLFEQRTLHINPGDFIMLYTDGVTDATDAHLQDFGIERLQRVIFDHRDAPAADVVAALEQEIGDFVGPTAPFDDIAMVVIKCLK